MCGVVGGLGEPVERAVRALDHRGPDASHVVQRGRFWFGHTRLAIQDLSAASEQPFSYGDTLLVFNGELWNVAECRAELERAGLVFRTSGDTEVVAAMLDTRGADALRDMEGMFALAWTSDGGESMWLARDRFGEVPLHYSPARGVFASELGAMRELGALGSAEWFPPGSALHYTTSLKLRKWYRFVPSAAVENAPRALRKALDRGVSNRLIGDVPKCVLLSGGIDSAAVALLARDTVDVAYTAVMDRGSNDLRCAREVAERIGVRLIEVAVDAPTNTDLAKTVSIIEMPHKAQVEIAWPCLALARRIQADGFRVVLSGEGADELFASYGARSGSGLSYHLVEKHGWVGARREMFVGQHRKNFARCNKVFMRHGIECRLPFLDTGLAELVLGMDQGQVKDGHRSGKGVLSNGFPELPESVRLRLKLAFQDGLGIKDVIGQSVHDPERFYRSAFATEFPGVKP